MNEKRKEEKPKGFVLRYKRSDGKEAELITDMTKDEFVEVMIDLAKKNKISKEVNKELIGISSNIKEVCDAISEASQNDHKVMILGETGTGKQIVAEQIHEHSQMKGIKSPLVRIECTTIPHDQFEPELFGAKGGRYSGVSKDYDGRIKEADNGTLFLDEIGELPEHIQAKFLGLTETKKYYRMGDNKEKDINFRLICATNRPLERLIGQESTPLGTPMQPLVKQFKPDLYYRIAEKVIKILPLRERRADILPIFLHLIKKIYPKVDVAKLRMEWISLYYLIMNEWYGNVRELENRIKQTPIRYRSLSEVINYEPFSLFGGVLTKLRQFRNDQYDISFPVYVKDVSGDEVPGWGFGRINVVEFAKKLKERCHVSEGRLTDAQIEKMLVDEGRILESMPECRKQREAYKEEKRKLEEQQEKHPPSLLEALRESFDSGASSKDTLLSLPRSSQEPTPLRSDDCLDTLAKKGIPLDDVKSRYIKKFLSYYPIEKSKQGISLRSRANMLGVTPKVLDRMIRKYSLSDTSKKSK